MKTHTLSTKLFLLVLLPLVGLAFFGLRSAHEKWRVYQVRALAQRSVQASRETAAKFEESVRDSDRGVQISTRVALHFAEIVEKARKVDALVAEIATASQEQTQGIEQVNIAVAQMDRITPANASGAEESAAQAEELNAQAAELTALIGQLLQVVGGARANDPLDRPGAVRPGGLRRSDRAHRPAGSLSESAAA